MATSDIEICSQACVMLGEGTVETLDENDDVGAIVAPLYEGLVRGWLAKYPWSFCKQKKKLSRLTTAPISSWQYAFQLPSDRLSPSYAVYDTDALNARPIQDFAIIGDTLMCNKTDIWIDYLARPLEDRWPPYFETFAVHALASAFAVPLTDDITKANFYHVIAFGPAQDNGKGGLLGEAQLADSQAQPGQVIVQSPLIDARFS